MPDKFFLDSNIYLYLFDKDRNKAAIAEKLFNNEAFVSTQVLAETINVLVRKFEFPKNEATKTMRLFSSVVNVQPVTLEIIDIASSIFNRYGYSFFDSMIIASALKAECSILYSEDLSHKQIIDKKLTIINPFSITE